MQTQRQESLSENTAKPQLRDGSLDGTSFLLIHLKNAIISKTFYLYDPADYH